MGAEGKKKNKNIIYFSNNFRAREKSNEWLSNSVSTICVYCFSLCGFVCLRLNRNQNWDMITNKSREEQCQIYHSRSVADYYLCFNKFVDCVDIANVTYNVMWCNSWTTTTTKMTTKEHMTQANNPNKNWITNKRKRICDCVFVVDCTITDYSEAVAIFARTPNEFVKAVISICLHATI